MKTGSEFTKMDMKKRCKACLNCNVNVIPMSAHDIILYQKFIIKIQESELNLYMCVHCSHLLKKFARFVHQCLKASNYLDLDFEVNENLHVELSYCLSRSALHQCNFDPHLKYVNNSSTYDNWNDYDYDDDDEIPLISIVKNENTILLNEKEDVSEKTLDNFTSNADILENNINIQYDKNKLIDNELLNNSSTQSGLDYYINNSNTKKYIHDNKQNEYDNEIPLFSVKNEDQNDLMNKAGKKQFYKLSDKSVKDNVETLKNYKAKKRKKKSEKPLIVGFTSRMVRETSEYKVIKLTKEQVLEEMKSKSQEEKFLSSLYKCEKCVKGFNFEDVLKSHLEKHSMNRGPIECDICHQYCPHAVSFRGHMKSHTTRYKCKVCGTVRLSRQHLLEHYALTHTTTQQRFSCDTCQFVTDKRTVMQRHVKTHYKMESHACEKCGRLFKNLLSLRVHTIRHGPRPQCTDCGRRFLYPAQLQKHQATVHQAQEYYCVECDVKFQSEYNLQQHFKKAKSHRDPATFKYKCDQCAQAFPTTSTLATHMTSAHRAARTHSCGACERRYSNRDTLRSHVRRIHTAERMKTSSKKSHVCSQCGVCFTQKSSLKTHEKTTHLKVKENTIQAITED